MKVTVKTLKGNQFDLIVEGTSTVAAVKQQIEERQGKDFPADSQLLIYKGKVLSDDKTLAEHSVSENGFLVVMTTKTKAPAGGASSSAPAVETSAPPPASVSATTASVPPPAAGGAPSIEPVTAAPVPAASVGPTAATPAAAPGDLYGESASNLVAGQALESTIARIMDMGGGVWDRETVVRALHAAYNNPDRAIDYLYSGIPETAEPAPPVARPPAPATATGAAPAVPAAPAPAQAAPTGPNAAPLDLFPQGMPGMGGGGGGPGALDFLRNNPQFQALRVMVQANPQILQPMLQELGKQNPQLLGLINNNQAEFLRLINEPGAEGGEGDLFGGMPAPQPTAINVTPEEREAIGRLEALGFDRAIVIEAFFACDKNEQLAANYLLEHAGEFDD